MSIREGAAIAGGKMEVFYDGSFMSVSVLIIGPCRPTNFSNFGRVC